MFLTTRKDKAEKKCFLTTWRRSSQGCRPTEASQGNHRRFFLSVSLSLSPPSSSTSRCFNSFVNWSSLRLHLHQAEAKTFGPSQEWLLNWQATRVQCIIVAQGALGLLLIIHQPVPSSYSLTGEHLAYKRLLCLWGTALFESSCSRTKQSSLFTVFRGFIAHSECSKTGWYLLRLGFEF